MKQEDTKQKILEKALELFSTYGYDSVSVGEIAKAVGIKAPSLYNHFPSKQAIFDAIVEATAAQYEKDTDAIDIHVQNAAQDISVFTAISEDALFVVDEGQLRCSSCRSSRFELERYGVEIPAQGLDLLRHVQQSFPSGWPDGELPPPVRRACARAIDGFVQYHLGLAWEGNYFRRV